MKRNIYLNADAGTGGGGAATTQASPSTEPWQKVLPVEMQGAEMFKTIPDVPTLAKNYMNAQKLIGMKRVAIPGKDASPEQLNEFYSALGRPEAANKYTVPSVKPLDGVVMDQASMDKARETFFKLGIPDSAQVGLLEFYINGLNETHTTVRKSMETQKAQGEEALRKDWGDKYDGNLTLAKNAMKEFITPDSMAELEAGLGNNPAMVKMFHSIGMKMMESTASRGAGGSSNGFQPGDQAQGLASIEEMKGDEQFQKAFNDPRHPGHKAAVDKWLGAHRKASPGKVAV